MNEISLINRSFHVRSLEELYRKLDEAKIAIQKGNVFSHEDVMARLRDRLSLKTNIT